MCVCWTQQTPKQQKTTHSSTSLAAFIKGIDRRYQEVHGGKFIAQSSFHPIWLTFVKQQRWKELGCMFCGTHPKRIVYDGVSICVQKDRCGSIINPKTIQRNAPEIHNKNMPNSRYIENYLFRNDMLSYVITQFGNYKRDRNVETLNDEGVSFCEDELKKYDRYIKFHNIMQWALNFLKNDGIPKQNTGDNFGVFLCVFLCALSDGLKIKKKMLTLSVCQNQNTWQIKRNINLIDVIKKMSRHFLHLFRTLVSDEPLWQFMHQDICDDILQMNPRSIYDYTFLS